MRVGNMMKVLLCSSNFCHFTKLFANQQAHFHFVRKPSVVDWPITFVQIVVALCSRIFHIIPANTEKL
jgi:hypothetical protein